MCFQQGDRAITGYGNWDIYKVDQVDSSWKSTMFHHFFIGVLRVFTMFWL